jgi:molybdopterin-guanine dinucleotide biosynthesis protein A
VVTNSTNQAQTYIDNIQIKNITGFIIDEFDDFRAPIVGIYSAFKELRSLNYQFGFTLSCDNPFINPNVIQLLIDKIGKYNCVIPQWDNEFLEPLFAIYPINKAYQRAKYSIDTMNLKLVSLLDKSWRIKYLSIEKSIKPIDTKLTSFLNFNNPNDINEIKLKKK